MYHFYLIKFQFLTDSTDSKKPCERKAKNTFAHVCKICVKVTKCRKFQIPSYKLKVSFFFSIKPYCR